LIPTCRAPPLARVCVGCAPVVNIQFYLLRPCLRPYVTAAVRWLGVTAPHPLSAPVTSRVHFACAALVNLALLTALFLVTGNTEDNARSGKNAPKVGALHVGIKLTHTP
jgi:hypothetical protein